MNFEEHAAKALILAPAGIAVPRGSCATSAADAARRRGEIGPCVVKAQVPTGKRGKAGGIKLADTPQEAEQVAGQILGMTIGDYTVERLLVEEQAKIAREFYAAVLHDTAARKPLVLFSTEGGMDIEEIAAEKPDAIRRLLVDIDARPSAPPTSPPCWTASIWAPPRRRSPTSSPGSTPPTATRDAELVEINPLALLADGRVVALDCKFVLDDAALVPPGRDRAARLRRAP